MKRIVLFACVLLAACSPVVVTVPAAGGELLPEQIQRAADAYTATARVQATRAAQATAAGISARETSTAAGLATLSALIARQTEVALQLTADGGAALATDAAAVRTRDAGETAAWATPTWTALQTQTALDLVVAQSKATIAAAAADDARTDSEGRRLLWLVLVFGVLLGLGGLFGVAMYLLHQSGEERLAERRDIRYERIEQERAQTEQARIAAAKERIIEREGRPYVIANNGRLIPMLEGPQPTTAGHRHRWLSAIKRTVYAGVALGEQAGGKPRFGERDLAGERGVWVVNAGGSPSSTGYRQINQVLRRAGVWTTSGRDTTFAPGWTVARFEQEIDLLYLELPEGEPPDVRIPLRSSAVSAITAVSAVPQSE